MFAIKLCTVLNESQSKNAEFNHERRYRKLKAFFAEHFKEFYSRFEENFTFQDVENLRKIVDFLFATENFKAILVFDEKNVKKIGRKQVKSTKKRDKTLKKSAEKDRISDKNGEKNRTIKSNDSKQMQTNSTRNAKVKAENRQQAGSEIVFAPNVGDNNGMHTEHQKLAQRTPISTILDKEKIEISLPPKSIDEHLTGQEQGNFDAEAKSDKNTKTKISDGKVETNMDTLKNVDSAQFALEKAFKSDDKRDTIGEIVEEIHEHFTDEISEMTTAEKEEDIHADINRQKEKGSSVKAKEKRPEFDDAGKFTITEAFVCIAELQKFLTVHERKRNAGSGVHFVQLFVYLNR